MSVVAVAPGPATESSIVPLLTKLPTVSLPPRTREPALARAAVLARRSAALVTSDAPEATSITVAAEAAFTLRRPAFTSRLENWLLPARVRMPPLTVTESVEVLAADNVRRPAPFLTIAPSEMTPLSEPAEAVMTPVLAMVEEELKVPPTVRSSTMIAPSVERLPLTTTSTPVAVMAPVPAVMLARVSAPVRVRAPVPLRTRVVPLAKPPVLVSRAPV